MRKLSHDELLERQASVMGQPALPLTIILDNIRSLHNVGSIFRTCDGIGVEKIWLCGITGCPPNAQISKTALDAEQRVTWEYAPDIGEVVQKLKSAHYTLLALEQTDESVAYQSFEPSGPVALIVGNEVEGVADSVVSECDRAIEIEMVGLKNSLNVSVACGIAAYHIGNSMRLNNVSG